MTQIPKGGQALQVLEQLVTTWVRHSRSIWEDLKSQQTLTTARGLLGAQRTRIHTWEGSQGMAQAGLY